MGSVSARGVPTLSWPQEQPAEATTEEAQDPQAAARATLTSGAGTERDLKIAVRELTAAGKSDPEQIAFLRQQLRTSANLELRQIILEELDLEGDASALVDALALLGGDQNGLSDRAGLYVRHLASAQVTQAEVLKRIDTLLRAPATPPEQVRGSAAAAQFLLALDLIPALLERLKIETQLPASASRASIHLALRAIAVQDLPADHASWQAWWEGNKGLTREQLLTLRTQLLQTQLEALGAELVASKSELVSRLSAVETIAFLTDGQPKVRLVAISHLRDLAGRGNGERDATLDQVRLPVEQRLALFLPSATEAVNAPPAVIEELKPLSLLLAKLVADKQEVRAFLLKLFLELEEPVNKARLLGAVALVMGDSREPLVSQQIRDLTQAGHAPHIREEALQALRALDDASSLPVVLDLCDAAREPSILIRKAALECSTDIAAHAAESTAAENQVLPVLVLVLANDPMADVRVDAARRIRTLIPKLGPAARRTAFDALLGAISLTDEEPSLTIQCLLVLCLIPELEMEAGRALAGLIPAPDAAPADPVMNDLLERLAGLADPKLADRVDPLELADAVLNPVVPYMNRGGPRAAEFTQVEQLAFGVIKSLRGAAAQKGEHEADLLVRAVVACESAGQWAWAAEYQKDLIEKFPAHASVQQHEFSQRLVRGLNLARVTAPPVSVELRRQYHEEAWQVLALLAQEIGTAVSAGNGTPANGGGQLARAEHRDMLRALLVLADGLGDHAAAAAAYGQTLLSMVGAEEPERSDLVRRTGALLLRSGEARAALELLDRETDDATASVEVLRIKARAAAGLEGEQARAITLFEILVGPRAGGGRATSNAALAVDMALELGQQYLAAGRSEDLQALLEALKPAALSEAQGRRRDELAGALPDAPPR